MAHLVTSIITKTLSGYLITLANAYVCAACMGVVLCGICGRACAQTCQGYRAYNRSLVTRQPRVIRTVEDMITWLADI